MTIEALAAVLFGLILYDDDLAVLHVITEGEGIADPESFAVVRSLNSYMARADSSSTIPHKFYLGSLTPRL